nr:MAG TPA: hypothetical protein [Caudoviricetes sp.]
MRISHKVEFADDFVFHVLLRYIFFQIFGNINVQSEKQFVQRVGARILLLILNQVNRRIIHTAQLGQFFTGNFAG